VPTAFFVRRSGQISEACAGEAVVLDLDRDRYFAVRGSAARLWLLLERPCTLSELVDAVVAKYDVDRPTATSDVSRWLEEMLRLELIVHAAAR
jgi:hypothetical protein